MRNLSKFRKAIRALQGAVGRDVRVLQMDFLAEMALSHPDPVTYAELEKRLGITKAAVSRTVGVLGVLMKQGPDGKHRDVGAHLVDIRRNPYNPKEFEVLLTEKGLTLCEELNKMLK